MVKPILAYWKLRGIAQPIRYMLAYIGLEHEEKLYELEDEAMVKKWFEEDKFNVGLDFPNMPYWVEEDIRMTEFRAILRYLARDKAPGKNLLPSDSVSQRKLDMLENAIFDIWLHLLKYAYAWTGFDDLEKCLETVNIKLGQVSKYLGANKFLLGDEQPTYVDFMCYEMLFVHRKFDAKTLNPFPNLEAYLENFEAIPEIATFIKSPKHIAGPCTSSFAIHPI